MPSIRRRRLLGTLAGAGVASSGVAGGSGASGGRAGVALEWAASIGSRPRSPPTVVGGTVYVGGGPDDGHLYALDAATGDRRWRYDAGYDVDVAPHVVGDTAYVVQSSLHAVDAATGERRWTFETDSGVATSPTAFGDTVYVCSHQNSGLYAVDATTGDRRWGIDGEGDELTAPVLVPESEPGESTPPTGTIFVGDSAGSLSAVDAAAGERVWRYEADGAVYSTPTVATVPNGDPESDGTPTVFVGSHADRLHAVDAATGEERWTAETGGPTYSGPTVRGGRVYVGGGDAAVYAVDAATGEREWRHETSAPVRSSPTVAGGSVFVGTDRPPSVLAVAADTGEKLWSFAADGPVGSPVVVDGTVYATSRDGHVYAIEAGVDGGSDGSRVLLGTLGHHGGWARHAAPSGRTPTGTPTEAATVATTESGPPPQPSTGTPKPTSTPTDPVEGLDRWLDESALLAAGSAGLALGGPLVLGAAAYAVARREDPAGTGGDGTSPEDDE